MFFSAHRNNSHSENNKQYVVKFEFDMRCSYYIDKNIWQNSWTDPETVNTRQYILAVIS